MAGAKDAQRRLASHHRRILLSDDGVDSLLVRSLDASGQLKLLPATGISADQTLLCAPGELVPVRAELLDDSASFSLSWVNGESEPTTFKKGHAVPAGAHNQSRQAVRVRAVEPFSASALCELLISATAARGDSEEARQPDFWHLLSRFYVLAVLALAALGFLLWLPVGTLRALEVTVAILVVTCPCALGVATPLAYELVQAQLRRRGLSLGALQEAGWPGEKILPEAASNRIYVAFNQLRKLGLKAFLQKSAEGYFLDPALPVHHVAFEPA